MPGHTAGYRMDAEIHLGTVGFHGGSQFLNRVLGLSDSHTIPGNDKNVLGGLKNRVAVFHTDGFRFPGKRRSLSGRSPCTKTAE